MATPSLSVVDSDSTINEDVRIRKQKILILCVKDASFFLRLEANPFVGLTSC